MIVMSETAFALDCIKKKKMLSKTYYTLQVMAKYYFHTCGYKPKAVIRELTDFFVISNNMEYRQNVKFWDEAIDKIVRGINKYPPVEIDGVWITPSEIARIQELHNKTLEKLMFTILCLAKFGNARNPKNNNWVNTDYKEIFSLARVTASKEQRYYKMHELYAKGYFNLAKQVDNLSVQVNFVDNNICDGSIFVEDFRELGYEYLFQVRKENFIRCAECGVLTRGNKYKSKKYCKKCAAHTPNGVKILQCIDCGKEFVVNSNVSRTKRCKGCQDKRNRMKRNENAKLYYKSVKDYTIL